MKIDKQEILKISELINLELDDKEIEEIEGSIAQIVKRFDEMLEIEDLESPKITSTSQINQFNQEFEVTDSTQLFSNINNYDGEYVKTKKVIGDE